MKHAKLSQTPSTPFLGSGVEPLGRDYPRKGVWQEHLGERQENPFNYSSFPRHPTPLIFLVPAVLRQRRADFPAGKTFPVTGKLQPPPCLTQLSFVLPEWGDLEFSGGEGVQTRREAAQCPRFVWEKGILGRWSSCPSQQWWVCDCSCHTHAWPCPRAGKSWRNKGDKWQSAAAAAKITSHGWKTKAFSPHFSLLRLG